MVLAVLVQRTSRTKGRKKQTTGFKKKKKEKGDFNCFVCGEPGHIARKCCMLKGRKEGGQGSANVTVSEAGGGSRYVPSILLACQTTDWWIDTATNVHVCADYNLFSSYQACSSSTVVMGNGTQAAVRGIGRVDLRLTSGKTLSLKNVQHVPGINRNLLSGLLLCRDGYKLVFESNKFIISKFGLFIG
jgi:ribosomal protein L32